MGQVAEQLHERVIPRSRALDTSFPDARGLVARHYAATGEAALLGAPCLGQLGVDRTGGLRRHAGHALELLLCRGEHLLGRAEVT